jgi:hypothetical protein
LAAARNEAEAFSERAEEAANNTDTERRLRMQVRRGSAKGGKGQCGEATLRVVGCRGGWY